MNKAEKAALDAAVIGERVARALRWSDPTTVPKPTLSARLSEKSEVIGWLHYVHEGSNNALPGAVSAKWSSGSVHGDYYSNGKRSGGSQNGRILFVTRLDALRAMRAEYEEIVAKRLALIDAAIAEEIARPTKHPEADQS